MNGKDDHGNTSLILAARENNLEIVQILLEGGADINIRDEDGHSVLMIAKEEGHSEIAEFLEQHGANEKPPKSPKPLADKTTPYP